MCLFLLLITVLLPCLYFIILKDLCDRKKTKKNVFMFSLQTFKIIKIEKIISLFIYIKLLVKYICRYILSC